MLKIDPAGRAAALGFRPCILPGVAIAQLKSDSKREFAVSQDHPPIDWTYPQPRAGLAGVLDKLIGPGATRAERLLQILVPSVAAIAAPLYAATMGQSWSWVQYLLCMVLAFDLVGGVVTNATSSAKRWYHRNGQGFAQHVGFTAAHLLHLLLVAWLYLDNDWTWAAIAGGYLLAAADLILMVPVYLQRPTALILYLGGLVVGLWLLPTPPGLDWFLPVFYLKLLVSHLPREEPYRPVTGD